MASLEDFYVNAPPSLIPKDYDADLKKRQLLGSPLLAQTYAPTDSAGASDPLTSGRLQLISLYIPKAMTATGAGVVFSTSGAYTANNTNGIALYSYLAGTLTRVAQTANSPNLWKSTADTFVQTAFSAPVALTEGIYFVGLLFNSSATTTLPRLYVADQGWYPSLGETNSAKLEGRVDSQTSFPTSLAMSGVTVETSRRFYVGLY